MEQNHSAKYIYDIIRSSIENGIYVYGQPIPPERTLADLYLKGDRPPCQRRTSIP